MSFLDEAHVALLPLEPTRFNQHKSDLKFIECAAHGVAALASPTVYERTITNGETGLIYHSPNEFELGLEKLIDDSALSRRLGENARGYAVENRMFSASLPRAARLVLPDAGPQKRARLRIAQTSAGSISKLNQKSVIAGTFRPPTAVLNRTY